MIAVVDVVHSKPISLSESPSPARAGDKRGLGVVTTTEGKSLKKSIDCDLHLLQDPGAPYAHPLLPFFEELLGEGFFDLHRNHERKENNFWEQGFSPRTHRFETLGSGSTRLDLFGHLSCCPSRNH